MKMTKRILSLALALVMILSYIPAAAFAADSAPALPTASVKEISNDELTFAMNFKVNPITEEQLAYYGNWYADFELTINKDVTFNADGSADGWLSGQYDEWSENWVNVPFGKFAPATIKANEPLRIMAFAAKLMGEPGLKYTYKEVYEAVRDFDCGVFFDDEFLLANPDLEVKLELKMYNPANEAESYVIGETYTYENPIVAKNTTTNKAYATATEALLDCADGQTVVMLKDSVESVVYVFENMTLDLNGHTLVANYMSSFGNIIDSSASNTGLLKVSPKRIVLQEKNKQLPVRDGDGYRFVEVLKINTAYWSDDKTFVFDVRFEPGMLELLKNGQESTGVTIQVRASWQEGDGRRTQNFVYKDEVVHGFLESYKPSTGGYGSMFFLELDSTEGFEDLTFAAVAVSTTGVGVSSDDPIEEEPGNVTTDANGQVVNDVTIGNGNASAVVPSGTQLENGVNNVTLNAITMEKTTSNITLGDGEQMVSMNVHVDGVAANNTKPIIVTLNELAPEFLNQGNLALYHVENGETVEMTRVYALSEVDAHNEYYYDIATGTVTMALATFSEIAVRSTKANSWNGVINTKWYNTTDKSFVIYNADQLAGLGAIVGGMADGIAQDSFADKTVKLMADIDLNDVEGDNKIFYPIGYNSDDGKYEKTGVAVSTGFYSFCGTFDGNGHTIANFYQNTWEMKGDNTYYDASLQYYRDGMGLFGKVYGGTIKNLTVKNFQSDGEYTTTGVIAAYADCGANFENISITECNPRVYNIGNGGIVGCVGWYAKEANTKVTFKNITVDNTNKITALWGSWDVACGGILGQYYPTSGQSAANNPVNGGVEFSNCHVAAQIDVYNDVCANYQYYAYRYSGMLIGSVRENKTINGHSYPDMTGITAENCTVHFGDWNDYYYCELVANSQASYTHDYQMSRLTQILSIDVENRTYVDMNGETQTISNSGRYNYVIVKAKDANGMWIHGDGHEYAECYHFVDGQVWNHEDADKETVDGVEVLKEDKQLVYREFNNLVTGYGWGVTSKWVEDVEGVKILDREIADSIDKFAPVENGNSVFVTGSTITIDKLFEAIELGDLETLLGIRDGNVQVFVSPVEENGTVRGIYDGNEDDWTKGTLTFSGTGKAVITITDYFYCNPVTIEVMVNAKVLAKIDETEYTSVQDALDAAQNGDTITLVDDVAVLEYLDVYTKNFGEIERSITLDLNGKTISWGENYKYEWYPLVFVGINQTLTIKNGFITAKEHVAVGAYGHVNLEGVTIAVENLSDDEQAVCIWNWSEGDEYYKDCELLVTGSATISGGNITGGILVEGPVTLNDADVKFDKLYLNAETGFGKVTLPEGYSLVAKEGYFTDLHKHKFNADGTCTTTGCNFKIAFVKTDLADIQSTDIVVITMTKGNVTWALTSANGSSSAPTAVVVSVDGDVLTSSIADALKWNISKSGSNLTIYPNGTTSKWLYCNADNNGVRVGTNANKTFTIAQNGYLQHTATSRYVGVYTTNPDWRCYTSTGTNIQEQELAFYVLKTNCAHENKEERAEIAATCTQAGNKAGTYCRDCNTYIDGGDVIDVKGHNLVVVDLNGATCIDKATIIYRCTVCNKRSQKTTYADHTWGEATCTDPSTCVVCGAISSEALGHSYEEKVTKPATCTEDGIKTFTCSCGDSYTETIAALGHQWGDWKTTTEASCTASGEKTRECDNCDATETQVIEKKEHSFEIKETAPTCCKPGSITSTCSVCGEVETAEGKPATGEHTYTGDCTAEKPETPITTNRYYIATMRTSGNYWYMTSDLGTASTKRYQAVDSGLTTLPASITNPAIGYVFILIDNGDGTYSLQAEGVDGNNYLGWSSGNSGILVTEKDALKLTVDIKNGIYNIHFTASDAERYLALNGNTGSDYFAWYKSGQKQDLTLIPVVECKHTNTTTKSENATCTKDGYSDAIVCADCGAVVTAGTTIPATGHTWEDATCETPKTCSACNATEGTTVDHSYGNDNKCQWCGESKPVDTPAEVEKQETMNIYANKGALSGTTISWTAGDITVSNSKAGSSTAIRTSDSDHYRIYGKSTVTISTSKGELKTVVFTCTSSGYATALTNSLRNAGYSVSVSSSTVTVTLSENTASITFTASEQIRINKIVVTYTSTN